MQNAISTRVVRKLQKEQKADAEYEAGTCFMALDAVQKYHTKTHRPLEHLQPAQSL
jgi:hypothetical protein